METMLLLATGYAALCVILAMLFCTVRLLIGPAAHDRALALDTLWVCGMLLTVVLHIRLGAEVYLDAAMLIALVGFVSTIAVAKFLMRGEIIE